jgi:hypothetical protein
MIDRVSDELEHEFDVFYDPLSHRPCCAGINLAVMEYVIGKRPPTTDPYHGPSNEEVQQRRTRGAIEKLHSITIHITGSPQRLRACTILGDGLRLRRDNDTSWNSWYQVVEWALRPKVRQFATIVCAQDPALQQDILSPCDWVTLIETGWFLKPFQDATMPTKATEIPSVMLFRL